ncbi:MAG: PAS domain-containing protein [Candidatus Omnitrophica bacterium]|nr:PAS domain-containing protein [Candidatus Omnitrophota bacterium]
MDEKLSDEIKFLQIRITELEKSESRHRISDELLRKTELQQKAILNNIPDIAWLKNRDSRYIAVNEPFARTCGFKPEEIIDKTDFEIWPRELAEKYRTDDQDVVKSGKRHSYEELLIHKSGKSQWVETIKTPIYNDKGEVIGTTGIARDITERKKYEERLREARAEFEIRVKVRTVELSRVNEDLSRHQNQLKELIEERTNELEKELALRKEAEGDYLRLKKQIEFILDATKTGLDIIDSDLNLLFVDSEWAKVYGDYRGKKCYEYFMGKSVECDNCGVRKALKLKKTVVTEERLIFEGNRPIQVITMPYQSEDGKWLAAEVNVDISERKKIEGELVKYRDYLEDIIKERTGELLEEISEHKEARHRIATLAENLSSSNKRLKKLSLTDSHTGLYNHRYLGEVIEAEFHRARRYAHNLP